ncbi:unnamed protein product [Arctia plantaginis]|uniref:Uncharacterized protein n=1 Tax=Arctia plantaginis TaxID=874455 RepID=A0A8S1AME9_ARCPL|nr:unnamed protein product [Arctia plantaginis]
MGKCCVEGCQDTLEDIVYFEFPASRSLRRKWLDVINIGNKVPTGTVVCSQHFHREEYEIVRGKVRLKRKVVPTLLLQKKSPEPQPTEKICDDKNDNSKLPEEKIVENQDPPQPDSTTDNMVEDGDTESGETFKDLKNGSKQESGEPIEIPKVVNRNGAISLRNSIDRSSPQPDSIHPPDFEEMITNYQIKNSKPHSLLPQDIEIEVPASRRDDAIVVDDRGDAPPVFIEIAVDKDTNAPAAGNEDCLMVLESVQVDVDPSSLMLPERDFEDEPNRLFEQEIKPPDKRDDPISLLTSSDEEDVIIQEPHIDTVEVSDETDEDDVPLVKLVKKEPSRKKQKKKKKSTIEGLDNIVWNGEYEFYCMQCHFTTSDNLEYHQHLQEHETALQICSVCSYTTASKSQFKRHLRKHKDEKKYRCHLCEYRARHNMSLIYHVQSHEADKHYVQNVKQGFKCMKCGCFHSALKAVVLKHVRSCGSNVKRYSCDKCDYVTKRNSDLKRHWLRRHQDTVVEIDSESSYNPD